MRRKLLLCCAGILFTVMSVSCARPRNTDISAADISPSLVYRYRTELDYAEGFSVDYYEGGYKLITVSDGSRFFVVPDGMRAPGDIPGDIVILQQPIDNIYLAATAVMDMFVAIDAVDSVSLSGTKESGWYLDAAKTAMSEGKISYAGKYSAPDYETILSADCSLAIESTMILHSPEVKEKLEELGIPVFIDRSSYEGHPLGKTEWVKLYGALTDRETEAKAAFDRQKELVNSVIDSEGAGKTAAFFYITSNGTVNVRKSGDYVPKMIELAGGEYIFSNLKDDTASSSVNMQMEEFYAAAKDADYLVYNSVVDGEIGSREELLRKSELFADFKAFSDGNVFCMAKNLYQESMSTGTFILDLHKMLTEDNNEPFEYLFKLE